MALHQLRIRYSTIVSSLALNHVQKTWIKLVSDPTPETPVDDIDVATKGGGNQALVDYVVTTYMPLVRPLFHTTSNFNTFELWQYEDANDTVGEFIGADVIGLAGSSANPTVVANQAMITLKGGVPSRQARVNFMETVINSNLYDPYPIGNSAVQALANFLIGNTSAHTTLVGQFLNFAVAGSYGEHETLFKKRFRG